MERPEVLVVEDRASIRWLMELGLASAGLRVRAVACADEAARAIRALRPDLVICDLLLPGGGAEAFIGELRGDPRTRDVPVIVTSGLSTAGELGRRVGADECIPKPFDVEHLVGRVRFHLAVGRSADA